MQEVVFPPNFFAVKHRSFTTTSQVTGGKLPSSLDRKIKIVTRQEQPVSSLAVYWTSGAQDTLHEVTWKTSDSCNFLM